jgi:hypothetical protein
MSLRPCPVPGCGTLTRGGRCPAHLAQSRASRPTPARYHLHRAARAQLLPHAYGNPCPYCLEPMLPGQPLDLDHTNPVALGNAAPGDRIAHASCNRRAGGQLGHELTNGDA